jgi:hypothetical protein
MILGGILKVLKDSTLWRIFFGPNLLLVAPSWKEASSEKLLFLLFPCKTQFLPSYVRVLGLRDDQEGGLSNYYCSGE